LNRKEEMMRRKVCLAYLVILIGAGVASCNASPAADDGLMPQTKEAALSTATSAPVQPSATPTQVPPTPTLQPTVVSLELWSDAWDSGEAIPVKYSCDGENISPPLAWSAPPEGTASYALIMDDPDAKAVGGQVWDHWLLFNIPPEYGSLPEDIPGKSELADGSRHGKSSWGMLEYGGPCPPQGRNHRYVFSFYALDIMLDLEPGATKDELRMAFRGHILGKAETTWKYPGE
jgi:Raf kinase inhibitor-like YbhB/YbcL family protein